MTPAPADDRRRELTQVLAIAEAGAAVRLRTNDSFQLSNMQQSAGFFVTGFEREQYAKVGRKPDRQRRERLADGHGVKPQVEERLLFWPLAGSQRDGIGVRWSWGEMRVVLAEQSE